MFVFISEIYRKHVEITNRLLVAAVEHQKTYSERLTLISFGDSVRFRGEKGMN